MPGRLAPSRSRADGDAEAILERRVEWLALAQWGGDALDELPIL
jgi:hypothetical protein